MIWTAWNNGAYKLSGAGYGFKIDKADRDRHCQRDWKAVIVHLPSPKGETEVEVNVDKASFWNKTCRELIYKRIGRWLLNNHYAPWPMGDPLQFEVQSTGNGHFKVIRGL
ncbi:hypothetical protein [Spirosoma endbachense]|uniref:Uncharacterized protein n=1 Tax=Spirosoma endbachense TaxID=2666025 RepID=A0A6P1VZT7_9BACT|nr:hypothetical protein [Spirosoma endbachense]QHV97297.1 hypothetical protein GJR95_20810 [Spirosoma endbachense]